jgi:FlaA1/EpsC-like NDP-sugar epimerase
MNPCFQSEALKANEAMIDLLKSVAQQKAAIPAQIVLAWLLAQKPLDCSTGTTKLSHLEGNLGAASIELTSGEVNRFVRNNDEQMKKVIIIGASGSLAASVIEEFQKQKDVHLTLFLRNKDRLRNRNLPNARIVEGDVMDYQVLKDAIKGQDIVYVNLAGNLEAITKEIV